MYGRAARPLASTTELQIQSKTPCDMVLSRLRLSLRYHATNRYKRWLAGRVIPAVIARAARHNKLEFHLISLDS